MKGFKKTVFAFVAFIMVVLMFASCNASIKVKASQVGQLAQPLTAILDQYAMLKTPYPAEGKVSNNYAISYLITLINTFYADKAQSSDKLKSDIYKKFMQFTPAEIDGMLYAAFGSRISSKDLDLNGITNGSIALVDGSYYFGQGISSQVKVAYESNTDVDVDKDKGGTATFTYQFTEMGSSPKTVNGKVNVKFAANDSGVLYITDFVPDDTLLGSIAS